VQVALRMHAAGLQYIYLRGFLLMFFVVCVCWRLLNFISSRILAFFCEIISFVDGDGFGYGSEVLAFRQEEYG